MGRIKPCVLYTSSFRGVYSFNKEYRPSIICRWCSTSSVAQNKARHAAHEAVHGVLGKTDPAGIQQVQIEIPDKKKHPPDQLQAVHQGFEGKRKVLLNGFDDTLQIIEFISYIVLPILEVKLSLNNFIKLGGIPVPNQEKTLFGALEIEHNCQPVFRDLADKPARWAQASPLLEEVVVDLIKHVFNGFIQHPIAQQLIIADLEKSNIRLKIAVRRNDDGALPIHQRKIMCGITGA